MKCVLVVSFSQTGQLERVASSLLAPLQEAEDIEVVWQRLEPQQPYPFPWPFLKFFDQFPEAVYLRPPAIKPLPLTENRRYDLIILAYTVWYLSPAPPMTAFLKSELGRSLLKDTPVVTVIACRNMWLMAQHEVEHLLADAGARLTDNVALTDGCGALASFVTTPRWMLTGRKDAFLGLPAPGIRDEQIRSTRRFGLALRDALRSGPVDGTQPLLRGLKAATVDPRLIFSEHVGRRSFRLWGALLLRCGPQGAWTRAPILALYAAFLLLMIGTLVPLSMIGTLLWQRLAVRRCAAQKARYEEPSGSEDFKMQEYSA